jgi:hypothetical protein
VDAHALVVGEVGDSSSDDSEDKGGGDVGRMDANDCHDNEGGSDEQPVMDEGDGYGAFGAGSLLGPSSKRQKGGVLTTGAQQSGKRVFLVEVMKITAFMEQNVH